MNNTFHSSPSIPSAIIRAAFLRNCEIHAKKDGTSHWTRTDIIKQLISDGFLEEVNCYHKTGMIPNLFTSVVKLTPAGALYLSTLQGSETL